LGVAYVEADGASDHVERRNVAKLPEFVEECCVAVRHGFLPSILRW
jgi:hypothetical protein